MLVCMLHLEGGVMEVVSLEVESRNEMACVAVEGGQAVATSFCFIDAERLANYLMIDKQTNKLLSFRTSFATPSRRP